MDNNQPMQNIEQAAPQVEAVAPPQQTFSPPPPPEPAKKSSKKALIVVIVLAILAIAGAAGGVYYYMDQQLKNEKSALDNQITDLNSQITKLKDESKASALSDTEALNYLTIAKFGPDQSETKAYGPIILVKDNEWAITSAIYVEKDSANGWTIPARGGSQALWRKVNGVWTYVGINNGITSSWSKPVQDLYSVIPTSIIPEPRVVGSYSE